VQGFFGTFEHTLDGKSRVILPAKFRPPFEHGGYLTQFDDGCLALWPPEEFQRQAEQMRERGKQGKSDRNAARYWAAVTQELEIDRQGRLVVPARMRGFAGLETDVMVVGFFDHIELWNPSRWLERVGPEEERLSEGADN